MRAIQVRSFGGPEVLEPVVLADPVPAHGELLVEVTGVGVNYADTHQAENTYLSGSELPFVPGAEVVGHVVDPSGPPRRRVCGFVSRGGGYAEKAVVRPEMVFDVPDGVSDTQALSLLVQGLTAWHLVHTSARLLPGESVVVHAAAGGVGNLAVQLAKHVGRRSGHRHRVLAGEARPRRPASAPTSVCCSSRESPRTTSRTGSVEANGGTTGSTPCSRWSAATTFDGSIARARAFRPPRHVRHGVEDSLRPRSPPSSLMVGSHSVIGFWLMDCMREQTSRLRHDRRRPLRELIAEVAVRAV